jgi:putative acyl-CoA dehydrogenase
LLAFRLSRAFDRSRNDDIERKLVRLITPIAKYWLCKRLPPLVAEAMECLGGNGYVEEAPLARLYREAPLNGIWEGSGNVICLDVLRSLQKERDSMEALLEEMGKGDERVRKQAQLIFSGIRDSTAAEPQARRVVESLALALQASLMVRYSSEEAANAFYASRIEGSWGRALGTLPPSVRCQEIAERQRLAA